MHIWLLLSKLHCCPYKNNFCHHEDKKGCSLLCISGGLCLLPPVCISLPHLTNFKNWKPFLGISTLTPFAPAAFKLTLEKDFAPIWNFSQVWGTFNLFLDNGTASPVWNAKLLIKNPQENGSQQTGRKGLAGISGLHASSRHKQLLPSVVADSKSGSVVIQLQDG